MNLNLTLTPKKETFILEAKTGKQARLQALVATALFSEAGARVGLGGARQNNGWFGDLVNTRAIGSRLVDYRNAPLVDETASLMVAEAKRSLQFLIDTGEAQTITITPSLSFEGIRLNIIIDNLYYFRPAGLANPGRVPSQLRTESARPLSQP